MKAIRSPIVQNLLAAATGHHQAGRLNDAEQLYRRILQADPLHADALHLLGVLAHQVGRNDDAVALIEKAIAQNGGVAAFHNNRGNALKALGRLDAAAAAYRRALALKPDHVEALYNLGLTLGALGGLDEAAASFGRALALRPSHAQAHLGLGDVLQSLRRPEEALASYDRAVALNPRLEGLFSNRAYPLVSLSRFDEALASCQTAIAQHPDRPEPYLAGAFALDLLGRPDEAMTWLDRAVALQPDLAQARMNRGIFLLGLGDDAAGWPDYESRPAPPTQRLYDEARLWRGDADLTGKRLFVRHEQGFGDTIQFCRYVKLLTERGVDVVLSTQDGLQDLVAQVAAPGQVIGPDDPPPPFDYHCRLLSLPLALNTQADTIPAWPAYLQADAGRRAKFETLLGPRTAPRIGLAWSGNANQINDHTRAMKRSIDFDQLAALTAIDAQWVCLQKDVRLQDAEALSANGRVAFLGDRLKDFSDTAALIDLMDLVISIDTGVAHLAGALGKPLWVLLPYKADWRWLRDRSDSPWYPSARLFRQSQPTDWVGVIEQIIGELAVTLSRQT